MLLFCKHDRVKSFLNEHYYFCLFVFGTFREDSSLTAYFKTKESLRYTVCSTEKYTKRNSNTLLPLVYFPAEQMLHLCNS